MSLISTDVIALTLEYWSRQIDRTTSHDERKACVGNAKAEIFAEGKRMRISRSASGRLAPSR
jgi:hypothetical protein